MGLGGLSPRRPTPPGARPLGRPLRPVDSADPGGAGAQRYARPGASFSPGGCGQGDEAGRGEPPCEGRYPEGGAQGGAVIRMCGSRGASPMRMRVSPRKNLYLGIEAVRRLEELATIVGVNEAAIVRAALRLLIAVIRVHYGAASELVLQLERCVGWDGRCYPDERCELACELVERITRG